MKIQDRKLALVAVAVLAAMGLTACEQKAAESAAAAPPPAAEAAPPVVTLTLPVSINQMMVALIDHDSDPIFDAGTKIPKNDAGWLDLEYHAYQMALGGTLMQVAGTGPKDAEWVADPAWKAFSLQLTALGMDAGAAAHAKDAKGWLDVGNKLIDVCEACHAKFKPDMPTMKILHKPDFPHQFDDDKAKKK
jgi:hypothetical protein